MTRQGIATIKRRSNDRPEKSRYRLSLASAVIGGIAVLLVIVIFTSALVRIAVDQWGARDRAIAASVELSKTFAAHVANNLHNADTLARWVEYEYEKAPRSFTLSDYRNRGLMSGDTVVQVTIVGKDGNVLQTTTPGIEAINVNDRPHFLIHANNRDAGLYISKPVIGRVSGKWTLQLTRRLDNPDGSFAGIVVVSESPNFLTDGFYGAGTLAPGTLLSVISDYGYLISRRTGSASSSHEGPSVSAYSDMIGSNGGVFTDPVDGVRRFVTYHHLAQYPVSVIVGLSERDELASSQQWKVFYLGLASFISLLILIVAVFFILMLARLKAAAETDSLTGLSNRYLLTETLRRRMHALGPSGQLAMIYIDLDNFKRVNDALGHKKGDELLLQVSYRGRLTKGATKYVKTVLEQIGKSVENVLTCRISYQEDRTAFHTAGRAVSLRPILVRSNWPLRMRCINSMPETVAKAFLNRLKPSITFVLDLMFRWSCSIILFRYFEDRTFVCSGSRPSAFISRTARCEVA